jgi:uncharacterized protein
MRPSPGLPYVLERLRGVFWSPVRITPPPQDVVFQRDQEVRVRDGTALRVNVFRPPGAGQYPVIMSAHPYGKDRLPRKVGSHYLLPAMYRVLRQTGRFSMSAWTSWEAPDPAYWVPRGYAVVNCDLRGFFRSDGQAELLSRQESEDFYDLIGWAAAQPWSNGKVGLNGVSYLALSQYGVAALQPPALQAICPWEGFSDIYRDLAYPGGIREDGFVPFWFGKLAKDRVKLNLRDEQFRHPVHDGFWESVTPRLQDIRVPALICGSFSDHNLHSRGAFEAFARIGSKHKWLYTHRTGKWEAFYSPDGLAWQSRFFDHFLQGKDTGILQTPPVRLEVRESRNVVREVRAETQWPLQRTRWTPLRLGQELLPESGTTIELPDAMATYVHTFAGDTELSGPMKLRLQVMLTRGEDACLFFGVRKLRAGEHVVFEGSYGFGHDLVTRGWLRLSHRELDVEQSTEWRPVHKHTRRTAPVAGEQISLEVELLPSATFFRAGEQLRLDIQGRYFFARHPLLGQFPAGYEVSPAATLTIQPQDSYLLVPLVG